MYVRFKGFPQTLSWKHDQPAAIPGLGEVHKGAVVNVTQDFGEWLLASKAWDEETEEAYQGYLDYLSRDETPPKPPTGETDTAPPLLIQGVTDDPDASPTPTTSEGDN